MFLNPLAHRVIFNSDINLGYNFTIKDNEGLIFAAHLTLFPWHGTTADGLARKFPYSFSSCRIKNSLS